MVIKHYKNKVNQDETICIIKDISSEKWYASKPSTRQYSNLFDNEDALKTSLSTENKWYSLQEHIDMMITSLLQK